MQYLCTCLQAGSGGEAAAPYVIEKVVDQDGETVYKHKNNTERVLDEDIAADVSYALEQVIASPGGGLATKPGPGLDSSLPGVDAAIAAFKAVPPRCGDVR